VSLVSNNPLGHGSSVPQVHASNGNLVGPLGPPTSVASMNDIDSAPQSPYSAYSTSVRDLTLPQIPNMSIPPSPPGSPPPGMEKKFEHFLELKRQGVHFNEKLARSSALKNPGLFQKLTASAGVDEHDQYSTTLPREIWDPTGFPSWAYKEELAKSQQELTKKNEEDKSRLQRESVSFISATRTEPLSRSGTPGSVGVAKGFRGSAAERVMAGLDRESTRSPQVSNMRNSLDRRGGRTDGALQETSVRSPKRKRSRSR